MRGSRYLVRSMAPAVGAVLVLTACGGDGDSAGGGSIDDWCSFAVEAERVDQVFDSFGADPSAIEAGIKEVKVLANRLPGVAPDEVKDDAKTLSEGALVVVNALEDADYNIFDADLSALDDADLDARNDAANASLDAFTQRECGRPFGADDGGDQNDSSPDTVGGSQADDDDDDDSGFDPGGGTLREQLVVQFESIGLTNSEATCLAGELDFSDPAVQSGDISAMLQFFGACGISLDRLAELGQG